MKKPKKEKTKCKEHKQYYCLNTGGNKCRTCKKLLDDFGNEE